MRRIIEIRQVIQIRHVVAMKHRCETQMWDMMIDSRQVIEIRHVLAMKHRCETQMCLTSESLESQYRDSTESIDIRHMTETWDTV